MWVLVCVVAFVGDVWEHNPLPRTVVEGGRVCLLDVRKHVVIK